MFKHFTIVTVLAVAIFGLPVKKKLVIEKIFEEIWRQRCNNVSGVELNIERNERLSEEYVACEIDAFNVTQFQEEAFATLQISNFTDNFEDLYLNSSSITPLVQKYCPKVYAFLNCKQKLSPIMKECYTAEEYFGQTVIADINKRVNDFFCENGASRISELINGKVVECAVAKKLELAACLDQYYLKSFSAVVDKDPNQFLFSLLPHADTTCRSIKTFGSCVIPIFQQCESETPGKLSTLLFSYIQTETKCASVNSTESTLS